MQNQCLLLAQFLPVQLVNLSRRVSDELAEIYRDEFDLSIGEWRIMAHLAEQQQCSASELIKLTHIDKSMMSRIIKEMELKNLVVRQKSAQDSRVSIVTLSKHGADIYQEIVPRALAWEAELLSAIDTADYRDLLRIMTRLQQKLDSINPAEKGE